MNRKTMNRSMCSEPICVAQMIADELMMSEWRERDTVSPRNESIYLFPKMTFISNIFPIDSLSVFAKV